MELTRSSFYYRFKEPDPVIVKGDMDILDRIESICLDFHGYGYRRVTRQLHDDGCEINHKKVLRLMRESDLLCRAKRKWVRTTNSNHGLPVYRNLVKDSRITSINQMWLADITYIRIRHGFVYLAAILDAFSRKVIGHAVSRSMDTNLVLEALRMAIANRKPGIGVIHHSDRGVQYASIEYTNVLKEHGFQISMSGKGNPYDNAMMESFFKTLKHEEVYLYEYETLPDVEDRLPYFIEQVYNLKRLHSSLGYRSPVRYEALVLEQQIKEKTRQPILTFSVQS
jgi:transposase InsO family protein